MDGFIRLISLIGEENFKKLQQSSVCILGVGGVGGSVVEMLVRSGIGAFLLVDDDKIEVSNFNRQLIATTDSIGKKKVEAWKERIQTINPTCQVKIYDCKFPFQKEAVFQEKIDYVIDCCDDIRAKEEMIMDCIDRNIPFLVCTGTGKRLDPSKLQITSLDQTSYDPLAKILRKWARDEGIHQKMKVLASLEPPQKSDVSYIPSSAFVPNAAGILIASEVVKDLLQRK